MVVCVANQFFMARVTPVDLLLGLPETHVLILMLSNVHVQLVGLARHALWMSMNACPSLARMMEDVLTRLV